MKSRILLAAIAVAEFATGLGLLFAPSAIVKLLLGSELSAGIPQVVGRVAGIALLSIGLTCWLERKKMPAHPPTGLLTGLFVYNSAIPVLLAHSYRTLGTNGIGLWPVVGLHLVFAFWLAACLFQIRMHGRLAQ